MYIRKSDCIRQVMSFRNRVAGVQIAVFSTPLFTCEMHVLMAYDKIDGQNFHFFPYKCLTNRVLASNTILYIQMRPRRDIKGCTQLTQNNKELLQRLSINDKKVAVSRLRLSAPLFQQ